MRYFALKISPELKIGAEKNNFDCQKQNKT